MMKKITVITSLYNCQVFIRVYLETIIMQDIFEDVEFLLLHNAPKEEELAIIQPFIKDYSNIKHVLISEREGLYKTWNRGISLASREYIAIWNVDDLRTPDSLRLQQEALDTNPDAYIAYGDFWHTYKFGMYQDRLVNAPDWNTAKYRFKQGHQIGCFPMWRKSIHDKMGYFDEQLKIVGDYDFQMRAYWNDFKFVKAKGNLGYYLENQPHKLSMNSSTQDIENNLVYIRYGMFDKLNLVRLLTIYKKFKVDSLSYLGETVLLANVITNHSEILKRNWTLFLYSPIHTLVINLKLVIKSVLLHFWKYKP